MHPENNTTSYLKLHFIIFIWGFTAVLGPLISLEALHLVWYRIAIALPFIYSWIVYRKISLRVSSRSLLKFAFGGFIIALHWIGFFMAIKIANVSVALVTLSTGAFFTSLLEPLFFKRKIRPLEVLLGLLIIGGLYLIFQVDNLYLYGMLWALFAAFLSALFSVINGLFVAKHSGFVLSFYQLGFGLLILSIILVIKGDFNTSFFSISRSDWLYLLILSSVCTAYAFSVSIDIMKKLSPYTVMLSINLEPVYGIILALLIFGDKEKMSPNFYFGALLILGIIILNTILKIRRAKRNTHIN
ncbi:MAG TPA: DMT family transporter [Saprospiraceae bacterium]|nr:DMT family transporter [Saprospiraceae bacterium]